MAGNSSHVRGLKKAIERDQFRLAYQPKADMRTGHIIGVEALARWDSPRRGPVTPAEFVPAAERRNSTIQALTDWTLEVGIRQAAEWQRAGHDLTVAINLSPRSLFDPALSQKISDSLERWAIAPSRIQLELTETAVFGTADPGIVTEQLAELAELGIMLALDDFGTGYSSLARLRDLPIHMVKIDRSFVSNMDRKAHDSLIVRSVIALAKGMHLIVVAEGIESEPVWRRLADLGCDIAQGNFLSPPLPPDELITWARQWEELYVEALRMATELLERRRGIDDRRSGPHDRRGESGSHRFTPTH